MINKEASQSGSLKLSGNIEALEKSQESVSEFWSCGISLNTVSVLFSQNSFYLIFCLVAKNQRKKEKKLLEGRSFSLMFARYFLTSLLFDIYFLSCIFASKFY